MRVYPVVVVKVNSITCKALLATGAGSSNASLVLLPKLNIHRVRKETKRTEIMMHSIVLSESFQFKLEVSKVEREMLLSLPNAIYEAVLKQCHCLQNRNK